MCGIAGIVNKNAALSPEGLLTCATAMASLMQHRGPDDAGVWVDPDGRAALSHRRLSIIDTSSAGHQPMLSPDGHHVLTYNGELYNFVELKAELESGGEHFKGRSDTEVLLRLLTKFGKDALPRLDSMFAFGFYDVRRRELLLARDIFGEKPLYYIDAPGYFAFASELHALTRLPGFDASIDQDAVATYLSLQYVASPDTIYRSCRKLPPAHWLRLDATGRVTMEPYFAFKAAADQTSRRSLDDLADELEEILARTVKRRLISDVPLGAFLSGGVDSATIAAIAVKKLGANLKTYSVGFEGHAESEHEEARAVAHHLGADHHEKILTPDALSLGQHIGKVLDEPNGDTSCLPTYLVSEFARQSVTVALSGDGGDELFGGYGRYFVTVDESRNRLNGACALRRWRAGDMYLSNRVLTFPDEELLRLFDPLPTRTHRFLQDHRASITTDKRPLINVLREFDAATYMPGAVLAKVDRMSMQHSLEVRAPLLGIEVAKFAMRLPADACYADGQGKLVLKRVASRYLPQEWMSRPKRGFGLPMTLWSNEVLLPSLRTLLLQEDSALARWVEPARLRAYVDGLARDFQPYRAWSLFILEVWLREHPATAAPRLANFAQESAAARMQAHGRRLRQAAGKLKAVARSAYRAGERAFRSRLGRAF
jgi:asparagine synthase (glutamine-hydrolysing)